MSHNQVWAPVSAARPGFRNTCSGPVQHRGHKEQLEAEFLRVCTLAGVFRHRESVVRSVSPVRHAQA